MKKKLLLITFIFLLLLFLSKASFAVTIVLDPGHGGSDVGATNKRLNLYERNQVWKIASYLKGYLEEYYDVTVYLTYPTLQTSGEPISKEDRAVIMKEHNADLAMSLHIDSSTSPKQRGATAFVTALPKYRSSMTELANKLLANLTKLGITSNGVKIRPTESHDGYYSDGTPLDYYGIIRHPTLRDIPIVLLEHCFISNDEDCKFIDSDEDLKKLARSDADAIVEYLGLKLPNEIVTGIKVDKESINLLEKGTSKLTASIEPSVSVNKEIKWASTNENVVKVDKSGNVTAVGLGKANITVTSVANPNISKTIIVNVEKEDVKFEKSQEYVLVGKVKTLNPKITPSWEQNKNLVWETSDNSIVQVSQDGKIAPLKARKSNSKSNMER